jgi:type IV pilus assembly protein PilO
MPIPKFSDLSPAMQLVLILVIGAAMWALTEYSYPGLRQVRADNETKRASVERLTAEVTPLRPFRERVRQLEVDNKQLENQLANLQRIVPSEKEVDNFVRLLQTESANAGIALRRIVASAPIPQQYHVEVPFQIELDGPYYDVMQFYDRLGRVERITNVSDLKMGGIQSNRQVGGGRYEYSPNETVVAVCTVTTFFSREEEPAPEEPPAAAGAAPRVGAPAPARARPATAPGATR